MNLSLSGGFCLRDSEATQEALRFFHMQHPNASIQSFHMQHPNVSSYSSAPKSRKQDPQNRTLDLPFLFHNKHITSLTNHPSPTPSESLPSWFQGNSVVMFVLSFWLRGFLLSAFANRFELRGEYLPLLESFIKSYFLEIP